MAYLQSYFDESGTIQNDKILSFCGFVGSDDDWKRCCRAWTANIRSLGIGTFKANHLFHYGKPLSSVCPAVGKEARLSALSPLVRAIRRSLPMTVSVTLDCAAFSRLPHKEKNLLGKGDPTFYSFLQALSLIDQYVPHIADQDSSVSIICDENHKYAGQFLGAFHRARQLNLEWRKRFVSIGFADDKFFFQLQIADFLASVMRQEALHEFYGTPFDLRRLYELFIEASEFNFAAIANIGSKQLIDLIAARKVKPDRDKTRR